MKVRQAACNGRLNREGMEQRVTNMRYMRLTIIRTAVLIFALIAASNVSADFEAGQNALNAGNMDEALSQWRDAANAGDRRAMLKLGRLYRQGLGVVQDYVEAHKWLNLAASRGEAAALEQRDALSAQMTPEQIAAAQQMAAAWQPGGATQTEEVSSKGKGQPPLQAIRAAQSLLATLGYQPGPADGVWGNSTKTAYQTFLRDMGLPQAEVLTPQSLRALQAAAEQQGAQTDSKTTIARSAQTPAPSQTNGSPSVSPGALHHAAQEGDIEVLKAVLAAGVDVNALDSRGWTALMLATNKGYSLLIPLLLEAQADVNIRAPDGATALFMAVAHGNTEIIELLMKAGADVTIRGPKGKTPVEVAKARYGDVEIALNNGYPPAVFVLLDGKAWTEAAAEFWKQRQYAGEMITMPPGSFEMGGATWRTGKPVHRVTIPTFKLGKYEVTVSEFGGFIEATGYLTDAERNAGGNIGCFSEQPSDNDGSWASGRSWYNPGYPVQDDQPVVCVSWNDAQAYIAWLNDKTNGNYRLPTESEWEYAARAGSKTKYHFGNSKSELCRYGNHADVSIGPDYTGRNTCSDGVGEGTAVVGSYRQNAFGLYDMHGNVWEWVQDCWNDSYKGAPTDGSAWTSGDCSLRVHRGGGWATAPEGLHSDYRGWYRHWFIREPHTPRANNIGFRLAQDE